MADGDYRMPPVDLPDTVGTGSRKKTDFIHSKSFFESTTNTPLPSGTAPEASEDRALPPEEVAPGEYIYTPPKKVSFNAVRKKLLAMYGTAAAVAVLLLTNIIPLYHTKNEVLPSGNLKILSVLTDYAGWQDDQGHTLIFHKNGTGYTYTTGFFGQMQYSGGEEGVKCDMQWISLNGGKGEDAEFKDVVIDNDNLKADGMNYTLSVVSGEGQVTEFRPQNFLSINTKYMDAFMESGIRGLFGNTEWLATTGGVEEIAPGTVYTPRLFLGEVDPSYEESHTIFAKGLFDAYPESDGSRSVKVTAPDSYPVLFREGDAGTFSRTLFFHIDPDEEPVEVHYTDSEGTPRMLVEGREHFDGIVLVTEDGYRLSWWAPFDTYRTYAIDSEIPDERPTDPGDEPTEPDETEEPTEEPPLVDNVRKALVETGTWQSDDGGYYVFREDGTGWVYMDGFFGIMSFDGGEDNVEYDALISMAGELDPESDEKYSYTTKNEYYGNVTPYDFFEENGHICVYLKDVDEGGITAFRPAGSVDVNTEYLDLFLEEGFDGLNRLGYWLITEDWIPTSMFPTPYTEFISFSDSTGGLFVVNTTSEVSVTSDTAFGFTAGQVDPMTIETSLTEKILYTYSDSSGSYTHQQDELNGFIRLLIKEDGIYVYANVPLSYPSIYKFTEN